MNTRAFTLALIIAGFAMFMVYTYIEDKVGELRTQYGRDTTVVVAKEDIEELELIDDRKVTTITVPQRFALPGHFTSVEELENTVASVPILKGEQITLPRITYPDSRTGVSRQIAHGKRAMSINVSETSAVSRLIRPGDRVDIIAGVDISSGRKDIQKTMTVLQDVLVLATGLNMTNSIPKIGIETPRVIRAMNLNTYTQYNTVTLELDPYQAQQLSFLMLYTGMQPILTLRNSSDQEMRQLRPTRIFDILGEDAAAARNFFQELYAD